MKTILAAQLAALSNGVASLDVATQKLEHSKSLVWEPSEARSQTFQKLYANCSNAFMQLCKEVDPRFTPFAQTLFSENSQHQDRTTMTQDQNTMLDSEIEAFLRLAGKWLNLTPAVMAVEWLIRRFRYVSSTPKRR